MSRKSIQPAEYGIDMDSDEFMDLMVGDFASTFRDSTTLDELLLHPQDAFNFCESIRAKHGFAKLPDDIILRSVMLRRKNPR